MHVVFLEPFFPANQREFVRALHAVGARVTGLGEAPLESLPPSLREQLFHYEQVPSVVDTEHVAHLVGDIQTRLPVDRLEATVEAHIMTAAHAREACGIPGTSSKTAWLCRDKPSMKEVLREAGVACAQSLGTDSSAEAREFVERIGFPVIFKPRSGAGAAGTSKVTDELDLNRAIADAGLDHGGSVAIEEFMEGHEAFYDTLTIGGNVTHEFITHYFPGVLEAMRTRWISPQFIVTNRVDSVPEYDEVKAMGRDVVEALEIDTSPTHMEWFFGPKGLKFSEIGCRPPGVGAWDLYCAANDFDLYREWAMAVCYGRIEKMPSRRFSAGIINLRPDRDGQIAGYEGIDQVRQAYGEWIIDYRLPDPGTSTQDVAAGYMANAWIRMRHPDYDELRRMLDDVGRTVQVKSELMPVATERVLAGTPTTAVLDNPVVLLGPQRDAQTLARVLREAGVEGPVAVVASGWEEREEELEEAGQLNGSDRNLQLFRRAERLYRRHPELDDLRQAHLRQRRQVRRLYGVRLQHIFDTWQALGLRHEEPALVQEQRASLMDELRRLDDEHLHRIDRLVREYAETFEARYGDPVQRQRREVARVVADCGAVVLAGGNVSTLQETLEIFALGAMLEGKVVVGWSAGAMALTDRVVLYHDHPPQGVGNPEVLCRGLGIVSGLVVLPHAAARLDLHDPGRVARLATRFGPSVCATLDRGAVLHHHAGRWRTESSRAAGLDGSLQELAW